MKLTIIILGLMIIFPGRSEFNDDQREALNKVARKLSMQQQEPYFPSGLYTILKSLSKQNRAAFEQARDIQVTLNGNEVHLIKEIIDELILGDISQKKQAIELSYTLTHANALLLQEDQNELNTQFAKAYFSVYEKSKVNFDSKKIYQRRIIQDKINGYLISSAVRNPHTKQSVELIQISKILGFDSINSQIAYLLSIYGLPMSQDADMSKEEFLGFIEEMIPNLLNSSVKEERIIAYLLDKFSKLWSKKLKHDHDPKDIVVAQKLVKSLVFETALYLPRLTPRSIRTLAVNDLNIGHSILISSHINSINTSPSVKSINTEAQSLATQGNDILKGFIRKRSLPDFELTLHSPKDRILTGSSAKLSLAVLISSYIDNFILDSSLAYTGYLFHEQVKYVRGVPAKLMGAYNSGIVNTVIPKVNFTEVNDFALLHGYDILADLQVFGVSTLQEALDISHFHKKVSIKEAIHQFSQLPKTPEERQLLHVLKLYPNHLSARVLLSKLQKKTELKLSFGTSIEEIKTLTHKVLKQQSAQSEIVAVLQKLNELESLLHQDSLILVDKIRTFLKKLLESKDLKNARIELIDAGEKMDSKIKDYYKTKAKL